MPLRMHPSFFLALLLPLVAAAVERKPTGPAVHLPSTGCTAVPIGCWTDCLGADGATSIRTLPIGVSGCCSTDQDPPGGCPNCATACVNAHQKATTKDFDKDVCPAKGNKCPACVAPQLTGAKCADFCAEMNPNFVFAGVEFGVQCFCGTEMDALSKKDDPLKPCTTPCGGSPTEMCGGGCSLTMYEINCGSAWGAAFLITIFVCTLLYVGGGVGYVSGACPCLSVALTPARSPVCCFPAFSAQL